LALSGPLDRQTITTNLFDNRGNSLHQTVLSEGFVLGAWTFSSMQDITNDSIDIYDQTGHSVVKSYSSAVISAANFTGLDDITFVSRDKFGNVEKQNVKSYNDELKTILREYKEILNTFKDDVSRKRGNAETSTVTRWTDTSKLDAKLIDKK